MENTPGYRHVILGQQNILSFPSGLKPPFQNEVTFEVFYSLKKTLLNFDINSFAIGIVFNARDFESRKWPIIYSKWRITTEKEGDSRGSVFQTNYYLQSERGLLQNVYQVH